MSNQSLRTKLREGVLFIRLLEEIAKDSDLILAEKIGNWCGAAELLLGDELPELATPVPKGKRRFIVRQLRDAWQTYEAVIDAADPEEARRMAKDDSCVWHETGVESFDHREFVVFDADYIELIAQGE